MQTEKTIGTHSGAFHMDEVLGCAMLTKYTKDYQGAKITRTRDMNELNTFDLILDVGGKYDPATNRFDHHQREFTDTFSSEYDVRLSSAGLIYKHFGREVIRNISQQLLAQSGVKLDLNEENINLVYERLYNNFILSVDAIDNGVNQFPKDIKPKYVVNSSLSQRIGRLNPAYYEEGVSFDERFFEAMKVAEEELIWQVKGVLLSWLSARNEVEKVFLKRHEFHESGEIIVLEKPCSWKEPLFDLEKKNNVPGVIKFILFPDTSGSEGWRVQAVPEKPEGFTNRKSLKKEWQGVARDELAKVSGIQDIVFCHASGFIGGARSFESVMQMATQSLKE